MRILLDALPLVNLTTGISRYLRNLYRELQVFEGVEVVYFDGLRLSPKMPQPADPGVWIRRTDFIWKWPAPLVVLLRSAAWLHYEMRLRRLARPGIWDLYHETAFTPSSMRGIPQVFTSHDLSLMECPSMHPRERVWFASLFLKRRLPYAGHVITVSEYSRSRLCLLLGLPPEKVTVIHEAPDPHFFPRTGSAVTSCLKSCGLPQEYFLFVGTLEPRKNLDRLIQAMAATREPCNLVLVGWEGWGEGTWRRQAQVWNMTDRLFATGYVDEESLACLYSGARALIYPSLYEGFGLPVLEAMACGCPVVSSHATSLPEVAGDAALMVDPLDPGSLTAAINEIGQSPALRQDLQRRGFERVRQFSWHKAAEETLRVFQRVREQRRAA